MPRACRGVVIIDALQLEYHQRQGSVKGSVHSDLAAMSLVELSYGVCGHCDQLLSHKVRILEYVRDQKEVNIHLIGIGFERAS